MPDARAYLLSRAVTLLGTPRRLRRTTIGRHAGSPALTDASGTLTWGQVEDRVLRLSTVLAASVPAQGTVAVWLGDRRELLEVQLAAAEACLVLGTVHRSTPATDVPDRLSALGARLVVTDEAGARELAATGRCPHLEVLATGDAYEAALRTATARRSRRRSRPGDVASVGGTSGTTGVPKVIRRRNDEHIRSISLLLRGIELPTRRQAERVVVGAPLTASGGSALLPALLTGGQVVIPADVSAPVMLDALERYRATMTICTPSVLIDLLDDPSLADRDLSALRTVVYGSELMPGLKLAEAVRRLGPVLQQAYGAAEVLPPVALLSRAEHLSPDGTGPADQEVLTSCGRPAAGVSIVVLDEQDRPVPKGQVGEITIAAPTVFDGYHGDPDATARALRGGRYHTGDTGRLDADGRLHVLGRRADLLERDGRRFSPRPVEEAAHHHPAVKESCYVQVGTEVVLVVSLRQAWRAGGGREGSDGGDVAAVVGPQVAAALAEHVSADELPDRVEVVDELPRSVLAKVLRREVRAQLAVA